MAFTPVYGNAAVSFIEYLMSDAILAAYSLVWYYVRVKEAKPSGAGRFAL